MSIKLLSQIWEHEVTGNTRAVLQVLCDFANDDGVCWPSIPTIAWKVGCHENTVVNVIRALVADGVVAVIEPGRGRGISNHYRVDLDALPIKPPKPPTKNPQNPQSGGEKPTTPLANSRPEPSVNEPPIDEPSEGSANGRRRPFRPTTVPDDFTVTDTMRRQAIELGCPPALVDGETAKFLDHFRANGKPMRDWAAAWRNWMRRVTAYGPDPARPVARDVSSWNQGGTGKVVL